MNKDWFYLKDAETGEYLVSWIDTDTGEKGYCFGEKATVFRDGNIGTLPTGIQIGIKEGSIVKEAI